MTTGDTPPEPIFAAAYVRMSTEHQQYSTSNQMIPAEKGWTLDVGAEAMALLGTIDKRTYKSAAVTANVSLSEAQRARPLFTNPHRKPYVFCDQKHCCYVEDVGDQSGATREGADCPLCGIGKLRVVEMITPEVFLPEDGREVSSLDDDSDYSFTTPAQFPVPLHQSGEEQELVSKLSERLEVFRRANAQLVVVNKGDPDDQSGFHVCDGCGRAKLAKLGQLSPSHKTPYKVLAPNRMYARVLNRCEGEVRRVAHARESARGVWRAHCGELSGGSARSRR